MCHVTDEMSRIELGWGLFLGPDCAGAKVGFIFENALLGHVNLRPRVPGVPRGVFPTNIRLIPHVQLNDPLHALG